MSKETSKAMVRRMREDESGRIPWRAYFTGHGIDVGSGDDPLNIPGCVHFDREDGDANAIGRYFAENNFDFLHASQVLEHMVDPQRALSEWLSVVKPGGYVIVTVPDWVAYEGMTSPSRWNPDHKSSWSMIYRGSSAPIHVHIPSFLRRFKDLAAVVMARFVDTNYSYAIGTSRDQTLPSEDFVECWNEFVLRRCY